jgi:hypothetical protein
LEKDPKSTSGFVSPIWVSRIRWCYVSESR